MKQLTQAVFDLPGCPDWAKSAFICSRGAAWYCDAVDTKPRPRLGTHNTSRMTTRYTQIGSGYDATNWQNSAINRE